MEKEEKLNSISKLFLFKVKKRKTQLKISLFSKFLNKIELNLISFLCALG